MPVFGFHLEGLHDPPAFFGNARFRLDQNLFDFIDPLSALIGQEGKVPGDIFFQAGDNGFEMGLQIFSDSFGFDDFAFGFPLPGGHGLEAIFENLFFPDKGRFLGLEAMVAHLQLRFLAGPLVFLFLDLPVDFDGFDFGCMNSEGIRLGPSRRSRKDHRTAENGAGGNRQQKRAYGSNQGEWHTFITFHKDTFPLPIKKA